MVIFAVRKIDPEVKSKVDSCTRGTEGVRLLLDPNGQTAKRYNSLWPRRAYALDQNSRVIYVQPEATLDPEAPIEVGDLFRQNTVK